MQQSHRASSQEPPQKQRRTEHSNLPQNVTLAEYVSNSPPVAILDPLKPLTSVKTTLHAAQLAGFRAAVAARGAAMILLAAGQGSRFQANLPKVVHPFVGKPLARHAIDAAAALDLPTIVVLGYQKELVGNELGVTDHEQLVFVCQDRQMGTGHAVYLASFALPHNHNNDIIVSYADNPGVDKLLLEELLQAHKGNIERYGEKYGAMVVTGSRKAAGQGAAAYGRMVRKGKSLQGPLVDIVEKKTIVKLEGDKGLKQYGEDRWTAKELDEIDEFNSGIVVARSRAYVDVLGNVLPSQTKVEPPKYEYYATDFVKGLVEKGLVAEGYQIHKQNVWKLEGANTLQELQELERKHIAREAAPRGGSLAE